MKQQYRVMVLCPLMDEKTIEGHVFKQYDDQVLSEIFDTEGTRTSEDILKAAVGSATAANLLACDFAVINPPELYRVELERALCDVGIVPVYPVMGVSGDGMVVHLGYRNADTLPDPASATNLADRYRKWLDSHYHNISEEDLKYCPDPWRTFVRFVSKSVFKTRPNEKLH